MTTQALPEDIARQLDALRDIHLPDPVSWWPLAPGWWILAAAVCLGALLLGLFISRRRRSVQAMALRELAYLRTQQETGSHAASDDVNPSPALAEALSDLLRRVAIRLPGGGDHATQHGKAWSDYLMGTRHGLPSNVAAFLAVGPYARDWQAATSNPVTAHDTPDSASQQGTDTGVAKRSDASMLSVQEIFVASERWIRNHA